MDLIDVPIGSDADIKLSVSGGKLKIQVELSLQKEVDSLLEAAKLKFPQVANLIDMAEKAADAELSSAA